MVTRYQASKRLEEASSKIKRVWFSVQPLSAPENAKLLQMTLDLDRYARKLKTMGRPGAR